MAGRLNNRSDKIDQYIPQDAGVTPGRIQPLNEEGAIRSAQAGYESLATGIKTIAQIMQGINDYNSKSRSIEEDQENKEAYAHDSLLIKQMEYDSQVAVNNAVSERTLKLDSDIDEAIRNTRFNENPVEAVQSIASRPEYGDQAFEGSPAAQANFSEMKQRVIFDGTRKAIHRQHTIVAAQAKNLLEFNIAQQAKKSFADASLTANVLADNTIYGMDPAYQEELGVVGQQEVNAYYLNQHSVNKAQHYVSQFLDGKLTQQECIDSINAVINEKDYSTHAIRQNKKTDIEFKVARSPETKIKLLSLRDRVAAKQSEEKINVKTTIADIKAMIADADAHGRVMTAEDIQYCSDANMKAMAAAGTGVEAAEVCALQGELAARGIYQQCVAELPQEYQKRALETIYNRINDVSNAAKAGGIDLLSYLNAHKKAALVTLPNGKSVDIGNIVLSFAIGTDGSYALQSPLLVNSFTDTLKPTMLNLMANAGTNPSLSDGVSQQIVKDLSNFYGKMDMVTRLHTDQERQNCAALLQNISSRASARNGYTNGTIDTNTVSGLIQSFKNAGGTKGFLIGVTNFLNDAEGIPGAKQSIIFTASPDNGLLKRLMGTQDASAVRTLAFLDAGTRAALIKRLDKLDAEEVYGLLSVSKINSAEAKLGGLGSSVAANLQTIRDELRKQGCPLEYTEAVLHAAVAENYIRNNFSYGNVADYMPDVKKVMSNNFTKVAGLQIPNTHPALSIWGASNTNKILTAFNSSAVANKLNMRMVPVAGGFGFADKNDDTTFLQNNHGQPMVLKDHMINGALAGNRRFAGVTSDLIQQYVAARTLIDNQHRYDDYIRRNRDLLKASELSTADVRKQASELTRLLEVPSLWEAVTDQGVSGLNPAVKYTGVPVDTSGEGTGLKDALMFIFGGEPYYQSEYGAVGWRIPGGTKGQATQSYPMWSELGIHKDTSVERGIEKWVGQQVKTQAGKIQKGIQGTAQAIQRSFSSEMTNDKAEKAIKNMYGSQVPINKIIEKNKTGYNKVNTTNIPLELLTAFRGDYDTAFLLDKMQGLGIIIEGVSDYSLGINYITGA